MRNKRSPEEEKAYQASLFQLAGAGTGKLPGGGTQNKASSFQMGPRYWRPLDDTTVLALYPMHSSSGDSTLLEREDFERLSVWLHNRNGEWSNTGPQNTVSAESLPDGGVHFRAWWNSTPGHVSGSFRMTGGQARTLSGWMDERLARGWTGWRSGVAREGLKEVPPGQCDWALNVIIDLGTDYLADGENTLYYSGPEDMEYEDWKEHADWLAGGHPLVEFTATPVSQGRWWKTGKKSSFKTRAKGY